MSVSASHRVQRLLTASLWVAYRLNVVQGVVAAAKTVFAMALLGVRSPVAAVVLALVSFGVYTANDLTDVEEDAVNVPGRASLVTTWSTALRVVAATALLLGAGSALWVGGWPALAVTAVPPVAAFLYSVPLGGRRRLKDVFVLNTTLVSVVWALTVTLLPLVLARQPVDIVAGWVWLFVCLRSVVSVELFNVRDVAGDAAAGIETFPVVLGVDRTRAVLAWFDGFSLAVLGTFALLSPEPIPALLAIPVVCLSPLLLRALGTHDAETVCLAKDGEYLLLGLVGLLTL